MQAITVGTTVTPIAPAGDRDFLWIYNNDTNPIFLSFDGDPATLTTSNGFPVAAGTYIILDNSSNRNVQNKAVNAISSAGSANVRVQGV
jgi:hypothetical protein